MAQNLFKNSKFVRLYYQMVKELVEQHSSAKSKYHYWLDWFFLLYGTRMLFVVYIMSLNYETSYNYRKYDPVICFMKQNSHLYEPYVVFFVYLFEMFNFVCYDSLYRLNVQTLTWQWWHQLVVVNQDQYFKYRLDNRQLSLIFQWKEKLIRQRIYSNLQSVRWLLPEFSLRTLSKFTTQVNIWLNLENVDRNKLFRRPLLILPNVSIKLRSKLLLELFVGDAFCLIAQVFITLLYLMLIVVNLYNYDIRPHPWYIISWTLIELSLVYYALLKMIRAALFFVLCAFISLSVFTGHVLKVGRKMVKLIRQFRSVQRIPLRCQSIVRYHLAEHNKVCYLVVCGGIELFNRVMAAFLFSNIPGNVYLISKWVFMVQTPQPLDWLVGFTVIAAQCFVIFIVMAPMAWCCSMFHSPRRFIPKFQLMAHGQGWLWYKLKYDDLYNRLMQGPKIAISIGPLSSITYGNGLEFIYFYVGYLLMAFSQQIEERQSK